MNWSRTASPQSLPDNTKFTPKPQESEFKSEARKRMQMGLSEVNMVRAFVILMLTFATQPEVVLLQK